MVKTKKGKRLNLRGSTRETISLKEKKEGFQSLLEEMSKNERTRFRQHMSAKQIMQAQGKLLRAHWQKLDRVTGKLLVKDI